MAAQADGKLVVGGDFSQLGTELRAYLGRLTAAETVDTTLTWGRMTACSRSRCNRWQDPGRRRSIRSGTERRSFIGRLLANGAVDLAFNPGSGRLRPPWRCRRTEKLCGRHFQGCWAAITNQPGDGWNADGTPTPNVCPAVDDCGDHCRAERREDPRGRMVYKPVRAGRKFLGRLNANGTLTPLNPAPNDWANMVGLQSDANRPLPTGALPSLGGQDATRPRARG